MIGHRRFFLLGLASLPMAKLATAQTRRFASRLILAARKQIGVTQGYDGSYLSLSYPNGDVPRGTGVCTDVIIRAYRDAFSFDLQKAVHEDMQFTRLFGGSRSQTEILIIAAYQILKPG
jgi:uncharacterized protein YijF (DUF1287 family)